MAGMLIRTVGEAFVVLALIFGFVKESKVVKIERRAWRFLRRLRRKARDARRQELAGAAPDARYADEYETRRRSKPTVQAPSGGEKRRRSARGRVA